MKKIIDRSKISVHIWNLIVEFEQNDSFDQKCYLFYTSKFKLFCFYFSEEEEQATIIDMQTIQDDIEQPEVTTVADDL